MKKYAQMWRISDDIWHSDVPYPQGLGDQFANVAKWAGKVFLPSEPGAPFGHRRMACGSEAASVPHKRSVRRIPCEM